MPNLVRLIVLPSKGANDGSQPPSDVVALAQELDSANPRSQIDLGDAYFNSAAMHQSFKQKMEVADPGTALIGSVTVEPAYRVAHEVTIGNPNDWTPAAASGGGVLYSIAGTGWFLGIRFA